MVTEVVPMVWAGAGALNDSITYKNLENHSESVK